MSAASFLARGGWEVTVLEKLDQPGGRARQLKENGFSFDMGPSWYWMPEVFERYFASFGSSVSDYYELERLNPSYRVYWDNDSTDVPASVKELRALFNQWEPGAGAKLDAFLKEAEYKYRVGIEKLVYKPGRSIGEFLDWDLVKGLFRLDVFTSISSHIKRYFKDPRIIQLLEFPVLFLGALPKDTPALYSLMNYADIIGGTWYPKGGMYKVVEAMYNLALELGVEFRFNEEALSIELENNSAKRVVTRENIYEADVVIGGADYHFIEQELLPEQHRTYSSAYWDKRVMAPSCLLYYVGLNRKLENVLHHSLFFDVPFELHGKEIYSDPQWPTEPLFYVSASSVTDPTVAPEGQENLVFLIPVAAGLEDDDENIREYYFQKILKRFEAHIGQSISNSIIYKKSYSHNDFVSDYNSFKGNAYGLANTLNQTAIFRPSCKSNKVKNLYYTGQLTVPGPGVPPSLISGEVVAKEILKSF